MRRSILLFVPLLLLASCSDRYDHPDTSACAVALSVKPFYKDLFANESETIDQRSARLSDEYGAYFDTYCDYEIRIGRPGTAFFSKGLAGFLAYDENGEVLAVADSVYSLIDVDDALSDAFSCFRFFFPDTPYPSDVFCHFSGFNNVFFVDSTFISFGIEHFLGADCRFYGMLDVPMYARTTKDRRYLVSDMLRAWMYAVLPDVCYRQEVLSELVYQAKVIYAVHRCIPHADLALLLGFDEQQMEWCRKNEGRMWAHMAEKKLLYSTEILDINKIVKAAPFTSFFSNASPGRAALYCAYNIVALYMRNNPQVSLRQLMDTDSRQVLQGSRYNP